MSARRARRLKAEINVVPYIDVMLVLLVIFMVTAPLVQPFEIALPRVGKGGAPSTSSIEVLVRSDKQGCACSGLSRKLQWRVVGSDSLSSGDESQLLASIRVARERDPDVSVGIAADRTVCYETVLRIWDLLKRENVAHVGLLAQPLPARAAE